MERELPLIACTLAPVDQRARVEEWRSLLAQARSRADVAGGRRYVFDPAAEDTVRLLASAERECCSFLEFEFEREESGFAMTVTTRREAEAALRFLFT